MSVRVPPSADKTASPGLGISRRSCLLSLSSLSAPLAWLGASQAAHAGGQLEEPLMDSVRTALTSAIANQAPPEPEFFTTEARLHYLRWLGTQSDRLRRRKPDWEVRRDFLQTVWYESKRAGLDVSLVMGLIQVESAFRKYAVSSVGARGYMQVMPFWTRVIGDGDAGKLFHMQTNLRFGCVILRHYIDRERGDLFMALGRYNGSRGKPPYPNAVFAAQRNWTFAETPQALQAPAA
ncbi:MAG: lytic transglycosylase domain-containing protein [Gammaproteobacteria bacterium]|jgi:soluble lytic murein transglycosylase-like protein|nr:lytic transglycosylase domain-containing protein [Gammaproteobacteria bacterium]MBU0826755.1 lytic transglycosylase domain-containing protein [Gammaproteobacteria bacterium]MBU0892093.1 lytic transglycosylase domain-containing protein [Gammaproteobacteria bacterium]MBU1819769.1 lytic transglycosylase domain-containing protein [Gammaproteobacteria bacterium]